MIPKQRWGRRISREDIKKKLRRCGGDIEKYRKASKGNTITVKNPKKGKRVSLSESFHFPPIGYNQIDCYFRTLLFQKKSPKKPSKTKPFNRLSSTRRCRSMGLPVKKFNLEMLFIVWYRVFWIQRSKSLFRKPAFGTQRFKSAG